MRRRSGYIWIAAGIALAVLAGLLAVWLIMRVAPSVAPEQVPEPEVQVVVAARFIPEAGLILDGDIDLIKVPADIVPENAARRADEVTGRVALIPISPDEMILINQLVVPDVKGEHVGFLMDKDKVAVGFQASDLMARSGLVRAGDHVDLLFSTDVQVSEQGSRLVTFNSLQNVEIAALISVGQQEGETPRGAVDRLTGGQIIILVLDPQDALLLKYLVDYGGTVSLALRAPDAEEPFVVEPVDMEYVVDRFDLRVPIFP
jgi:Flp pilus assembly protein CpaB